MPFVKRFLTKQHLTKLLRTTVAMRHVVESQCRRIDRNRILPRIDFVNRERHELSVNAVRVYCNYRQVQHRFQETELLLKDIERMLRDELHH